MNSTLNYREALKRKQKKKKKALQNNYLQNYNLTLKYIHILNVKTNLNIKLDGQWCRLFSVAMATKTDNIDINIKHYMDAYMKKYCIMINEKDLYFG